MTIKHEKTNSDGTITIAGVRLADGAYGVLSHAECTAEGREAMVTGDLSRLRDGSLSRPELERICLDGADDAHTRGWLEYVDALCAAVEG